MDRDVIKVESLTSREKLRFERFDKEEASIISHHIKVVKLIESNWEKFCEQNHKAVVTYKKLVTLRKNDPKYQFNVNENGTWTLVGNKLQEKEEKEKVEDQHYKSKLKQVEADRKQWIKDYKKEKEKESKGKVLYDTESSEEEDINETLDNIEIELDEEKLRQQEQYITEQILALGRLHADYIRARNRFNVNSYDYAILDRENWKVLHLRRIYEHRVRTRTRILAGERPTLELDSDTDLSDGGYSDIEDFNETENYLKKHILVRKNRQPKPIKANFERREREKRERRQRQIAEEVEQELELEEEEEEENMANPNPNQNLKWSVQSVSKFHGDTGQNASSHLFEFNDFLRAARIEPLAAVEGQANDERNAAHIINDFVTTLKGKARVWYDMKIPEGQRTTIAHWNQIKQLFKEHFHPLGSTREQRVKAWKDMKWDPTTEAIDDFAYKYKELGNSLGLNEESIFDNFKACIPGQYYVFVYNADTINNAIENLKKCIAAGPMMQTVTESATTKTDEKLKFMSMSDVQSEMKQEMANQIQESLDGRLGPMEDEMSETKEIVDQMYQLMSGSSNNQGQNQNRFSQNRNNGGNFQRQFQRGNGNSGQRRNWQNGQNKGNGSNNFNVQCTYCKKWRHTIANCIFLKDDLRKKGFKITRGNGFGNNGGNFRPGQGRNNRGGFNKAQSQNRGRQDQINSMNDGMSDDEEQMSEDDLFMAYLSEFQEATGCEIEHETELNN